MDIEVNFDVNSDDSDEEFAEYTKNSVNELLQRIQHMIVNRTNRNKDLTPMQQLLLTLRFYATGNFYLGVGDLGVSKSVSGKVIATVSRALTSLRENEIELPPNEQQVAEAQQDFYRIARFPRVVGAVDGTQIRIQSPGNPNPEVFGNRKGYFSLNIQVAGNAKYIINDLVVRWPGSAHDSYIFDNSRVRARFENGDFRASVLLGDSGYPLRNYLMTPLANPRTPAEQLYNESQFRTRTIIERIIGIWKRRFPVLTVGLRCKIPLAQDIILATAILHNIARKANEPEFIDVIEDVIVHEDEQQQIIEQQVINNNVQRDYINYFEQLL